MLLDRRPVKTPARRALAAPTRALAEALANEWRAQGEFIEPASMPLTRLANSIIDGVADAPEPVAAEVAKYLASDLVFYRAATPEPFHSVGLWYDDFSQTTDDEVRDLLERARRGRAGAEEPRR